MAARFVALLAPHLLHGWGRWDADTCRCCLRQAVRSKGTKRAPV